MSDFYIIYPGQRYVTAAQIHTWYSDACANGQIGKRYLDAKTHKEMADALADAGKITLATPGVDVCAKCGELLKLGVTHDCWD